MYRRRVGPELLEMANEGLVLAARANARLGQALSAAQHAQGHLQVVGVGHWRPTSTRPAWNAEPRLTEDSEPHYIRLAAPASFTHRPRTRSSRKFHAPLGTCVSTCSACMIRSAQNRTGRGFETRQACPRRRTHGKRLAGWRDLLTPLLTPPRALRAETSGNHQRRNRLR